MVKIKNWYLKILSITLVFLFMGYTNVIAQAIDIGLPTNLVNQPGTTEYIPVTVGSLTTTPLVYSYSFDVSFNQAYVTVDNFDVTGTITGTAGGSVLVNTATAGKITVSYAGTTALANAAGQVLIKLKTNYIASVPTSPYQTGLTISNVNFNGINSPAVGTITNGLITGTVLSFPTLTPGTPPSYGKSATETVNIPVQLSRNISNDKIVAYDIAFTYDATKLEILSSTGYVKTGTASDNVPGVTTQVNITTDGAGNGQISFAYPGTSGITYTGELPLIYIKARIKALGPNNSFLNFGTVNMYKNNGTTLTIQKVNGQIAWVNRDPVISPIPDQPVAEKATLTLDLRNYTNDPDGDVALYTLTSSAIANANLTSAGVYTFTPDYNQGGSYTVTFNVNDQNGSTKPQTVKINVSNVNREPSGTINFVPDYLPGQTTYNVNKGETIAFTVTGSDADITDPDQIWVDGLIYSLTNDAANPTVIPANAINANTGAFSWTPALNAMSQGDYKVTFTVTDKAGASKSVVKNIHVVNVNTAPLWTDVNSKVMPNTTIRELIPSKTFQYVAIDPNNDVITYSLIVNQGGQPVSPSWISINPSSGLLTITAPPTSAIGSYVIMVGASDNINPTALSPQTTLTIVADNAPVVNVPAAAKTLAAVVEGNAVGPFVISTSDADGYDVNSGDVVTLNMTTDLPNTVNPQPTFAPTGNPATGTFTWTPPVGSAGKYRFTFTAKDLSGKTSVDYFEVVVNSAKTVKVGDIYKTGGSTTFYKNDEVIIPVKVSQLTALDQVNSYSLKGTYTNLSILTATGAVADGSLSNGGNITVTKDDVTGKVTVVFSTGTAPNLIGANDAVLINLKAKIVEKGSASFAVDELKYDQNQPSLLQNAIPQGGAVVINTTNRKPVVNAVADKSGAEGSVISFTATGSDEDGDPLNYSMTFNPTNTSIIAPSMTAAGVFTWTPGYLQAGDYTVIVKANDGTADSDPISVKIKVTDVNHKPVLTLDKGSVIEVNQKELLTINFSATDEDADNTLKFTATGLPEGANFDEVNKKITWTPSKTQFGDFGPITVKVDDQKGQPNSTDEKSVLIKVKIVNGAPSFTVLDAKQLPANVTPAVREGQPFTFTFKAIDPDGDNVQYYKVAPTPVDASIDLNSGVFTWTPKVGAAGSDPQGTVYQVVILASDGTNTTTSSIANITVVKNTAPEISVSPATLFNVNPGTPVQFTVGTVDQDNGDKVKLTVTSTVPGNVGFTLTPGNFEGGVFNWTPAEGNLGSYTIKFTATDLSGISVEKTVTINVVSSKTISFGTIATETSSNIYKNDEVIIPILASNLSASEKISTYQFEGTFDPSKLQIVGLIKDNTISSAGTPQFDVLNGKVSVVYVGLDPLASSGTLPLIKIKAKVLVKGNINFSVTSFKYIGPGAFEQNASVPVIATIPVGNRKPVVNAIADKSGAEGSVITFTATGSDVDGDTPLTYSMTFNPANTSLVTPQMTAGGVFTWTPGYLQAGEYTVIVKANDGSLDSDPINVKITVTDVNHKPVLALDKGAVIEVNQKELLTINFSATDEDSDNTLKFTATGLPEGANFDEVNKKITWTPTKTQFGDFGPITVKVDDQKGQPNSTDEKSVLIKVKIVNGAPSFTALGANQMPINGTEVREGQQYSFPFKAVDPDGDQVTYYKVNPTPPNSIIDQNTGLFTWTPKIGDAGATSTVYQVVIMASDGTNTTTSSIANILVKKNNAPTVVVSNIAASYKEEEQISFTVTAGDVDANDKVELINSTLPKPEASFTQTSGNLPVGTFKWTPKLGEAGTYKIKFTVTDLSNVSSEVEVTLNVTKNNYAPEIVTKVPDQEIAAGTKIEVKYVATDKNASDVLTWKVVSPASMVNAINPSTGDFSYTFVTPGVVTLVVEVTDGTATTQATSVITVSGYTINGKVTYGAETGKALANVIVTLKKDGVAVGPNVTTDATGTYSFGNLPQGTYTISFAKTTEWGGVNAADALKIARYFAFKDDAANTVDKLDAIQMLAADVDDNGKVNNDDALRVLYKYVGKTDVVPFVKADWVFGSPASLTISNANVVNNVLALATGDVNKSLFTTTAKANASALAGSVVKINAKASFEIPVTANMISDLGSMSMKINYPVEFGKLAGVVFNSKLNNVMYKNNASDGSIAIAWYSNDLKSKSFDNKEVLFTLKFTATEKFQKGNSFALTLDPSSELTTTAGVSIEKSSLNAPKVEVSVPEEFSLKQNYPNPFNPSTTIAYDIPVNGHVKLVVRNILGQEVATVLDAVQDAGSYKVNWDASRLSSGVYLYTMTVDGATQKYTKTNRMVLMK